MVENDFITRREFELYKEATNRRLQNIEQNFNNINSTINDINTDTQLIIQKIDLLTSSTTENIKLINGRVDRVKSRVFDLNETLNDHINVEPRKEYRKLRQQILWLFISSLLAGVLASLSIFR